MSGTEAYLVPDPKAPGIRWYVVWQDPSDRTRLLRHLCPAGSLPPDLDRSSREPVAVTVTLFVQGSHGADRQVRILPATLASKPHSWRPDAVSPEAADVKRDDKRPAPDRTAMSPQPSGVRAPHPRQAPREFHNPYNFVPAPPPRTDADLTFGHRAPVGHHIYHDELWSGEISIELETVTPLLLPDAATARPVGNSGHKSFATRRILRNAQEMPLLPVTSFKGVLRSLYEAATNSRFGVFDDKHEKPLQRRISRQEKIPFEKSPVDLLPETLHPAQRLNDFSPADRLFGWVRGRAGETSGDGGRDRAYRGHLRIAPIICLSTDAIEPLTEGTDSNGLPLAILGQPKPQQARFYVAEDETGRAPADGRQETALGYDQPGASLRGRKVYPHQAKPSRAESLDAYWNATEAARTARGDSVGNGQPREYVRQPKIAGKLERDSQNRSMRDWVRPGVTFATTIQVTNVSEAELGALLWLLSGEAGHLRIGGGKPLGFGSVEARITGVTLCKGAARRRAFEALFGAPQGEGTLQAREEDEPDRLTSSLAGLIGTFKAELLKVSPQRVGSFEEIPFIKALKRAGLGHPGGLPTHYPRLERDPNPAGENYKWFGKNDRTRKVVLADLESDPGLPLLGNAGQQGPRQQRGPRGAPGGGRNGSRGRG